MHRRHFLAASLAAGLSPRGGGLPWTSDARGSRSQDETHVALVGASVFDSVTGRWLRDHTILLSGDRIAAVGPRPQLPIPARTPVVDLRGMFVIPGLIDAHVHLTHILYQSHMTGDEVLPFYLAHGVTGIRSTGDNVPAQRLVERYAEDHPDISPRVYRASFLIDGPSVHHPDVGWSLTDPAAVPAFVEHMAGWGVRTLKIYVGCERPVGRRVIQEGHRRGLAVSGHLERYATPDAVADGIDCLEHIYTVADFLRADPADRHSVDLSSDATRRLIDAIVASGVAVDPTLMVFWGTLFFVDLDEVIDHPDNLSMPRRLRDFWLRDNPRRLSAAAAGPLEIRRRTFARYKELVGMLYRAGAHILVGTDAPEPQVPPGSSLHHEMEFLVESGMSESQVLSAATLGNASILNEGTRLGSVEAGKLADLVVLQADPTARIQNTRRILYVVRGGDLLEPATILQAAPVD